MKISSLEVKQEHIKKVNEYLGYEENENPFPELSLYGYAFYYNLIDELDACDADRYANLNTIIGYNVGLENYRKLDNYLWNNNFDLMDLVGSEEQKEFVQKVNVKLNLKLDFSKWKDLSNEKYSYSYFEDGKCYK